MNQKLHIFLLSILLLLSACSNKESMPYEQFSTNSWNFDLSLEFDGLFDPVFYSLDSIDIEVLAAKMAEDLHDTRMEPEDFERYQQAKVALNFYVHQDKVIIELLQRNKEEAVKEVKEQHVKTLTITKQDSKETIKAKILSHYRDLRVRLKANEYGKLTFVLQ